MTAADLQRLKSWFEAFAASHMEGQAPKETMHMDLKRVHTKGVLDNIALIAKGEGLTAEDALLAEAIGLLHDVGRFPQLAKYKTFRDAISVNHAELGIETIRGQRLLASVSEPERQIIESAIRYHNAYKVPALPERERLFALMIRDADKLDVWRVFADFYEAAPGARSSVVGIDLPETPGYRAESLRALKEGKVVQLGQLDNLNDFRLLHISWAYDLTFSTACRLLLERRHIERIAATLPEEKPVLEAVAKVLLHLRTKSLIKQ